MYSSVFYTYWLATDLITYDQGLWLMHIMVKYPLKYVLKSLETCIYVHLNMRDEKIVKTNVETTRNYSHRYTYNYIII